MRSSEHLNAAEEFDRIAQATEDAGLRSIYQNMSALLRQLDLEMQRLAKWHRQHSVVDDVPRKMH
jgi:hypothetical protein